MPPRGEKKGSAGGDLLAGTATRAPRPGRSTAARSPTGERARRRGGRRRRRGLLSSLAVEASRSVSAAAGLSGEERGAKRERERAKPNEPRVQGEAPAGGFCSGETTGQPSDPIQRLGFAGPALGPGGNGCAAEFPAQAQVAAWARGSAGARGWAASRWAGCAGWRARARKGHGPNFGGPHVCWLGQNGQVNSKVTVFVFSYFPENSLIDLN